MKSYFLEDMRDVSSARHELSQLLRDGHDPWLLKTAEGDALAYFRLESSEGGALCVQADVSGRHFDKGAAVIDVMRELQKRLGGVVRDDNGGEI